MNEREKIISYLLAECDAKNAVIAELQAKLDATQKPTEKAPKASTPKV